MSDKTTGGSTEMSSGATIPLMSEEGKDAETQVSGASAEAATLESASSPDIKSVRYTGVVHIRNT